MPAGVFLDRNLSVRCAGQGSMPARARRFDAAMVNDDRGAAKGLRYRVSRPDVGGHILVAGFASVERAVQRVDIDCDRNRLTSLRADIGNQRVMLVDKIQRTGNEVEGNRSRCLYAVMLPEGCKARLVSFRALTRDIDDRSLHDAPLAVLPAQGDMQRDVRRKEALAAFRRAVDDGKAGARDQSFYEVGSLAAWLDIAERDQGEAIGRLERLPRQVMDGRRHSTPSGTSRHAARSASCGTAPPSCSLSAVRSS